MRSTSHRGGNSAAGRRQSFLVHGRLRLPGLAGVCHAAQGSPARTAANRRDDVRRVSRRRGRCRLADVPVPAMSAFENLLIERDEAVAVVTINRPKVLNALNTQTLDELRRATLELQHDAAIRAVVLTGAGEKSFVAGADINELAALAPAGARE